MPDLQTIFFGNQPLAIYLEILLRTVVMSVYTLLIFRFVAGRGTGFGEFSLFEFLLLVLLGSAAGDPMFNPNVPLVHGMFTILVVALMGRGILTLTNRSRKAERVLEGDPIRLAKHGLLDMRGLKRARVSSSEVFMQLRQQGIDNLGQVGYAYLEPDGIVSVFPAHTLPDGPTLSILPDEDNHQRHAGERAGSDQPMACVACGQVTPAGRHDEMLRPCTRCQGTAFTIARQVEHVASV